MKCKIECYPKIALYLHLQGGFPHSEISGSKVARTSPKLIAACHVFHRLLPPRHSLNALLTLDHSTNPCAEKNMPAGSEDPGRHIPRAHTRTIVRRLVVVLVCPVRGTLGYSAGQTASFTMSNPTDLAGQSKLMSGMIARSSSKDWWSQTGSNRRPPACKAGALPTE